jgi:outer membrane protein assembly factor BamB
MESPRREVGRHGPACRRPLNHITALTLGIVQLMFFTAAAWAGDWPQWCGTDGKNMVSPEKNLPDSFVPGQKNSRTGEIRLGTAKHVKWGRKLCEAIYSSPAVVGGKIFIGGCRNPEGLMLCLDERTGKSLWEWHAPAKEVPLRIKGWLMGISINPPALGVCSSPLVDENRIYFVSNDFKVVCLDARGDANAPGKPRVVWSYDMWARLGVFPCDAANGSAVVDGDLLYVNTSNGIDRNMELARERFRKIPAPDAPNLIVLEKHTGRLVATDDAPVTKHLLHGQWSSVSLGTVGGRKLIFFGGGDGRCYAFEALRQVPKTPVKLKTVWSCDCIPEEYKRSHGMDWVTYYSAGDKRRPDGLNRKNDGSYVGQSEFIGTPVLYRNRIYLAVGRDPEHGRGRGALQCVDATRTGDITKTGRLWTYQGLDRTLCTVSIADGLLYLSDVAGRLHCLDAETGRCYWTFDTNCQVWGSTLVADGKVYMPSSKGLYVLAAGKEKRLLSHINVGAPIHVSPVAANGTLYIASTGGWLWAVGN